MNNMKFAVNDMAMLEDVSGSQFVKMRIEAFASGDNAHSLPVSEECLKRTAHTIYDKPLVWIYDYKSDDIGSHDLDEIPCGFVHRENNEITFSQKEDGRVFLTVDAMVWKKYSGGILKYFKRDGMKKPVSVELMILSSNDRNDGKTEITDLCYTAITILGTDVAPAIPLANAEIIEFSEAKTQFYHNFSSKEITNFPTNGENKEISLRNSNFKQFDHSYAMKLKEEYPEIWKKGGNIRGNEAFDYWHKSVNGNKSQGVLDWIKEREAWMARHEGDFRIAGVIAVVKWGGIVKKGESYMKNLIDEEKKKYDEKDFSVGEELGKEESIKINNSKESAIMSETWNGQDADFLNKLLKASNHESLINEAYLITDKSGDISVNDVHYPHHSIKNGELVVNKKGVISAFQRAKQQGITGEPINHLKRHYKELGLDTENFSEGGKPLDKAKIMEMASKMECMAKYAMMDMDMEYAYAIDKESKMMYAIPYKMSDSEEMEFAMEDMKKAKMACKYEMMADDEEEDKEVYMAMGRMAKMKGFNDDRNIEAVAQAEENEKETDKMKEEAEEKDDDSDDVKMAMNDMEMKMAEMAKENEELKKFKEEVEMAQKQAKVDMESHMMAEKVNAEFAETWKAKVDEFDNVDAWANAMKAMAFSLVVEKKEPEQKTFSRMDIPNLHNDKIETKPKKFWEM